MHQLQPPRQLHPRRRVLSRGRPAARCKSRGYALVSRRIDHLEHDDEVERPRVLQRGGYLLNQRVALGRFLEAGIVPIDNGAVERLHVRTALTRKNYLFAGSDAGGERAAIAYTILGCCRIADIHPAEYLRDVLPTLTRRVRLMDLPDLLPTP